MIRRAMCVVAFAAFFLASVQSRELAGVDYAPQSYCNGQFSSGPVHLYQNQLGEITSLDVFVSPSGQLELIHSPVSERELSRLCASNNVALLPRTNESVNRTRNRAKSDADRVPSRSSLPIRFEIVGEYLPAYGVNRVFGNFWVPGSMPAEHNAQLAQFTMEQINFGEQTTFYANSAHFVAGVLAHSTDDFLTTFKGKGFFVGRNGRCFSPEGRRFRNCAVSQTWLIKPNGACPGISCNVWNGAPAPATGNELSESKKYDFLFGANRWQESVYWYKENRTPTWITTPIVNSFDAQYESAPFGANQAGIFFLVGGTRGAPVGNWKIKVSEAYTWTQP